MTSNIFGSIAGGVAAAGAGALASKALSGSGNPTSPLKDFRLNYPSAGGLNVTGSGSQIKVQPTADRIGLVNSIASLFPEQANAVQAIRSQVNPGFGALTTSRLSQLENARTRSIGNLRDNLARRRVLGSSFAQDAIARADKEFGVEAGNIQARSFLEELDITNNLINQEAELRRNAFQTQLNELNLEADLAATIATNGNSVLSANAAALAQLNAEASAGRGSFFGSLIEPAINGIGSGVEDFVKGLFN